MSNAQRLLLSVLLACQAQPLLAEPQSAPHHHPSHSHPANLETETPTELKLPPQLRSLLVQEMIAILDASQQMLAAIVRGDDKSVAQHAQAIHDSFILDQELSEQDKKQLHELAPDGFLRRDQALHQLSASLAEAARHGDQQRQRELFSEMMEACVGCHSLYAAERFPQLKRNDYTPEQHDDSTTHGGHHGH